MSGVVGRAAVRAVLSAAVDAAGAGRGRLLLVTGEAGIGKSRLLADAIEQARSSGFRVAFAVP